MLDRSLNMKLGGNQQLRLSVLLIACNSLTSMWKDRNKPAGKLIAAG